MNEIRKFNELVAVSLQLQSSIQFFSLVTQKGPFCPFQAQEAKNEKKGSKKDNKKGHPPTLLCKLTKVSLFVGPYRSDQEEVLFTCRRRRHNNIFQKNLFLVGYVYIHCRMWDSI